MTQHMQVWMLFACCVPVKGSRRSLIYDLQRGRYYFIPNALYELIKEHEGKPLELAKAAYRNEHDEVIDEYIAFLFRNELAFYTDTPNAFPKISTEWKSPFHITNAIIDSDVSSNHPYDEIIRQLSELGCAALQCRFYDSVSADQLLAILAATKASRLRSVELVLPFTPAITDEVLESLFAAQQRLNTVVLHSAPEASRQYKVKQNGAIIYLTEKISSAAHCGFISAAHFRTNIEHFTESQLHNSCLNRKVGIDTRGFIKNCPSSDRSFGHIQDTLITTAIKQVDFTKSWYISKDQVAVCRDCEFRYMCVDCRVFVTDDAYSKPSRCSYDPYTATWANEADDPQRKHFKLQEATTADYK